MSASVIEAKYPISFREKQAKELGTHLRHRQSVNIVGMKRIGISNFLKFFIHHKDTIPTYVSDDRKHIFITIDLNDLIELEIYPFWTLTLKRIVDAAEVSSLPDATKKKIASLFLNSIQSQDLFLVIDSVRQALLLITGEGVLPTLFFIRFDRIASVFTPSFIDNLHGLRDATHHELTYVFTSFRSLNSMFPAAKTSLSAFAQIIYMPPALDRDLHIIYDTYKTRYNFELSPSLEESLFKIVNGNVQYLQLALIILNEKKGNSVKTHEDLLELLTHDERINLQSEELWESLTKDEKKLLEKILRQEKITPEEKESLHYIWETGFVIEKNNKHLLFSPLFEAYLKGRGKDDTKSTPAIHLTKKEHLLFKLLETHIGNICEREHIIEAVWPEYKELGISDWAIDRLVARVRVKLKQQNSPYEIVTVRTRGYKLSAINE